MHAAVGCVVFILESFSGSTISTTLAMDCFVSGKKTLMSARGFFAASGFLHVSMLTSMEIACMIVQILQ